MPSAIGGEAVSTRALAVWILLAILAVFMAAVREQLIKPRLGEPMAHVTCAFAFIALMIQVIGLEVKRTAWVPRCQPGTHPE